MQVLEPEDELSKVLSGLLERERRLVPVAIIELHVHEDATRQVLKNEKQGVRAGHRDCLVQVNDLAGFSWIYHIRPHGLTFGWLHVRQHRHAAELGSELVRMLVKTHSSFFITAISRRMRANGSVTSSFSSSSPGPLTGSRRALRPPACARSDPPPAPGVGVGVGVGVNESLPRLIRDRVFCRCFSCRDW